MKRCLPESIAEKEQQISVAKSEIADNKKQIAELDQKKQPLREELGKVKKSSMFMQKAQSHFGELQTAVEGGQNPTNVLLKIVDKVNMEERYTLLNSNGVKIQARSFAEAWGEVEKVMHSDQEGFMKITFVEVPQLM